MSTEKKRLSAFELLLGITLTLKEFLDKAPNNVRIQRMSSDFLDIISYIEHLEKENRNLKLILKNTVNE